MDTNNDVCDGEVTKALLEVGTFKAVVSNHVCESVLVTCATNKQRKLIDSMLTSPGLTVLKCGFLPFHEVYGFNSDHPLIWDDICDEDLLGHCPQHIYRAPVSNIKSNDPDIREMYIQQCLKSMNVKILSMIIKPLLCFVRKHEKVSICVTRLFTFTLLLPQRSKRSK